MRLRPSFLLPAALLVLGACGGGGDSSTNNNPTSPNNPNNPTPPVTPTPIETSSVTVSDDAFSPPDIKVAINTTVTWTWAQGASTHNVSFAFDGSGSGDQSSNYIFTKKFSTLGTFSYRCTIHPTMTGSVQVQ